MHRKTSQGKLSPRPTHAQQRVQYSDLWHRPSLCRVQTHPFSIRLAEVSTNPSTPATLQPFEQINLLRFFFFSAAAEPRACAPRGKHAGKGVGRPAARQRVPVGVASAGTSRRVSVGRRAGGRAGGWRSRPGRWLKETRGRGPALGTAAPPRSMRKMLLAALSRVLQGPAAATAAAGRTVSAAVTCPAGTNGPNGRGGAARACRASLCVGDGR